MLLISCLRRERERKRERERERVCVCRGWCRHGVRVAVDSHEHAEPRHGADIHPAWRGATETTADRPARPQDHRGRHAERLPSRRRVPLLDAGHTTTRHPRQIPLATYRLQGGTVNPDRLLLVTIIYYRVRRKSGTTKIIRRFLGSRLEFRCEIFQAAAGKTASGFRGLLFLPHLVERHWRERMSSVTTCCQNRDPNGCLVFKKYFFATPFMINISQLFHVWSIPLNSIFSCKYSHQSYLW